MASGSPDSGVRLAELVATLSLAADLGLGQPAEHAMRSTVIARRLGDLVGQPAVERATTYWVTLLAWVGCTADSHELAKVFGDDIDLRYGSYGVDMTGAGQLAYVLGRVGSRRSLPGRAAAAAGLLLTGGASIERSMISHCEVTARFADRFGLGPTVSDSLGHTFARWDGKGLPAIGGADIPLPARILHVADIVAAHHQLDGVAGATAVARQRRGTQFDPDLVEALLSDVNGVVGDLSELSGWDEVVAAEPALGDTLRDDELDVTLEVLADFADLKSPFFLGHSRGVADLAAAAAEAAGHRADDVLLIRRGGLVHDIGRAGIPNTIWDKPGPLTSAEMERVRLHDYYGQRMLARPETLAAIGAVGSTAHERSDGTGYPRGAAPPSPLARMLAAADAYHAMNEARPHRGALTPTDAAAELRAEAKDGAFDTGAVEAVLAAAGHARRRRPSGPGGLTAREVEVLVLVARGASNRQVGQHLGISPKTAGSHIEHIYTKLGVTTRAAAALFAIQHGLLPTLEPLEG